LLVATWAGMRKEKKGKRRRRERKRETTHVFSMGSAEVHVPQTLLNRSRVGRSSSWVPRP
jgi:hypothetical protein